MVQLRRSTARWAVFAACAATIVAGSAAFACTNLATINLSSSMGKPGDAITVTGTGFMANTAEMPLDDMVMDMSAMASMGAIPSRSPVVLRWNGPDGPVLSEAIPDRSGTISVLFTIPETQSGHYTVVAVQKNPQGFDVYGTPARAPLQVIGVGGPAGSDVGGGASGGATGQSGSAAFLALTAGLGVLGLALLAAGGVAATRSIRVRRGVPVKIDGRND